MKKFYIVVLLVLALMFVMALALPVGAVGSADKATGSGMWVNGAGDSQYAEFNAHEAKDNRPAKGHHYQETSWNGGGTWSINVDDVNVYAEEGRACFGGDVYSATGSLASFKRVYVAVKDGGAAGDETGMDLLRAGAVALEAGAPVWCLNGDFGTNQYWSEGNVQIHVAKSYE